VIRIRQIDHVVLRVRDLQAMLRFYTGVLGCTLDRARDDLGLYHLRAGSSLIDLVTLDGKLGRMGGAAPGPEGHNVDHICLRVDAFEPAVLAAWLRERGVEPGEYGSRYGADGEGPSLYLTDPEGNGVELKGPPGPA
jgi:glyoxylase I family protein